MLKENRLNSENNETKKEKRCNHKLLKFFTLILCLFSFFTIPTITLSNVKAEETDSLQGTWVFNDTLSIPNFLDENENRRVYIDIKGYVNVSFPQGINNYIELINNIDILLTSLGALDIVNNIEYVSGNNDNFIKASVNYLEFAQVSLPDDYGFLIAPIKNELPIDDVGWNFNTPITTGTCSFKWADAIDYENVSFEELLDKWLVGGIEVYHTANGFDSSYTGTLLNTWTFTGGEDINNPDFVSWVQANATKQEEEPEAPAIPEIPSGYRQINSGDLLRTFGVDLATSLYIDTSATPTASATSTLTFNGNVNFTGYDASVSDYVSYTFTQFLVEVSSSGVYIYAQTNDYSVNVQWYNINTGWNDLFGGYTLTTDLNTTILLNGEMSAFYWLYVKDLSGYDNYTINLYQGEWPDTQQILDYAGLQYSINNGMTWNEINTLPLVVANVNQIMFLNNSSNTSTFYISDSALGNPLYSLSNGETSVNLALTENSSFYLGYILSPSENSYFISGGYRFNTNFSITGNYNYTLNFKYTFGTNNTIWNSIVILGNTSTGRSLDYRNGQGSWSVNVFSSDRLTPNIMRFNNNYPATERYITFYDQYVDETTYNFLINSGEFGVFSNPSDVIDGSFDFGQGLLNGVNSFLSFEIFPNFSLLNLLQLTIAIPLLIYILKLFLGG